MYGGVVVGGDSDGGDGSDVVVGYVEMIYLMVARFWRYIFLQNKKKKERKIKLIIMMA